VRLVLRDLRRIDVTVAPPAGQDPGQASTAPGTDPVGAMAGLVSDFQLDAILAAVKAAREDVLIGAHLTLGLARHVLWAAMLLRDRDTGTTHHRHGCTPRDTWAARLGAAPAPYTRRAGPIDGTGSC
jgi:hypothetical protein